MEPTPIHCGFIAAHDFEHQRLILYTETQPYTSSTAVATLHNKKSGKMTSLVVERIYHPDQTATTRYCDKDTPHPSNIMRCESQGITTLFHTSAYNADSRVVIQAKDDFSYVRIGLEGEKYGEIKGPYLQETIGKCGTIFFEFKIH
jgi:hypothetical protein